MKIYVRRRHIEAGKRGDTMLCPIALAYKEATGRHCQVCWRVLLVEHHRINRRRIRLPIAARNFVEYFDLGKPVKPFAFVLK